MRRPAHRPVFLRSLCAVLAANGFADPLFLDAFEDGDYLQPEGANGLSWSVPTGSASVDSVLGSLRLGLPGGTNTVVSEQLVVRDDFTLAFDARLNWSNPARVLFLYLDADNYYALGLASGTKGVHRRLDGVETTLYDDASSRLRLPHDRDALGSFKIHVQNTGTELRLRLDRSGDGRDYDVSLVDTNALAVARFHATRLAAANAAGAGTSRLFHLDNVAVHEGLLENPRAALTYYVDDDIGDDGRTVDAAQSVATPWRTVQRAASVAQCGDTVAVLPGVYRETVVPLYSGSADRPILYRAADPANRPVLDGSVVIGGDGWVATTLTSFSDASIAVQSHALAWAPAAAYQDGVRLFAAQEPNQVDADDPYDIARFRPVPTASNPGTSTTQLVDPDFLTHPEVDYWKGATLLLYDGFSNTVVERTITAYEPQAHRLTTAAFAVQIGGNGGNADRYALRHHRGILDQPGEYVVDATTSPPTFLVWPYGGSGVEAITASCFTNAFNLSRGDYAGLVVDGFELRHHAGSAVQIEARCEDIVVRNCRIHRTMASGVRAEGSTGVLVSNCVIEANHDNGVNFGAGRRYAVVGCEITRNGNNGIWAGTGGGAIFNTVDVQIRGNYLHHQGGRRSHADNYQMHQCDEVLLERNILVQTGEQNGWCQYTGHLTMRNNILLNGNFGVNSAMYTDIYHNAVIGMSLRYDAHLTDHPTLGDYYKPRTAVVRNNVFVNASLAWPATTVLNRFAVFTTDHNYYNSDSTYTLQGWDWQGYRCGIQRGGSMLVSAPSTSAVGQEFACTASIIWSEPARLMVLYKDPANYYAIGLASSNRGVYRRLQGLETPLYADASNLLRLPHASPAVGRFAVCATNDGSTVRLLVGRDQSPGSYQAVIADSDPLAVATFVGPTSVGLMTTSATTNTPWAFLDDVVLRDAVAEHRDGFEDGDFTAAEGPSGLTWNVVQGGASVSAISGRGVGFGTGSLVRTNVAEFASHVVLAPSAATPAFDLHLRKTSALRDAGLDVGVNEDLDSRPRPVGSAVDIGPYEYVPAPPLQLLVR